MNGRIEARGLGLAVLALTVSWLPGPPGARAGEPATGVSQQDMASRLRSAAERRVARAWWSPVAERGWLGVRLSTRQQLQSALAAPELPEEWVPVANLRWLDEEWDGDGVLVLEVTRESPAEKAGLLPGDVILSFNGIRTRSPGELAFVVQRTIVGHDGEIEVLRDGETRPLLVEIGMHPEDARRLKEEQEARRREGAEAGAPGEQAPARRKP